MLLYISIVVVSVGHLPFEQLEAQKDHAISAVAETFMGRFGFGFMAVGAVVAAVSAINADIFGSTRLMGMLAEEGPHRWKRVGTVFGGHPWKLVFLTGGRGDRHHDDEPACAVGGVERGVPDGVRGGERRERATGEGNEERPMGVAGGRDDLPRRRSGRCWCSSAGGPHTATRR